MSAVPPGRYVQTASLRTHVREAGEGDPVVLLHGFPQDSWMWRHQLESLSYRWRCIAPDTRGFGLTRTRGFSVRPKPRVSRDLRPATQRRHGPAGRGTAASWGAP